MNAVDTNVLIYAHDPRVARDLINDMEDGTLLWQVACEFLAASRKLVVVEFSLDLAFDEIKKFRSIWTFQIPNAAVFDRLENLRSRFSLSTWDSLLIAAGLEAGIDRLYTEDFSAYPNIDGMEIVNPFATT